MTERAAPPARTRSRLAAATFFLVLALGGPHGEAREIGPRANFCAEVNSLQPGEVLLLQPGEYRGPCRIRRGGAEGAPIIIRALDPARRPRIVYPGADSNVLDVRADHVVIRGLEFGPTKPNIDAVRIYARRDVVVEDCRFVGVGGIAVVANHVSGRGFTVRRNVVFGSRSTAMYFGCHDGATCLITDLVVTGNYIHGVTAAEGEIGYGIQVKLNSAGSIRDNIIADTKGPGIMVYGATNPALVSIVERNLAMGSLHSAGIVVGGGPAVVRNNVLVGNAEAGIALQDYGRRGLLRGIAVAHNTLYGNDGGGITISAGELHDAAIVNNAIHARIGTLATPGHRPGLRLGGNIDCRAGNCFVNPHDLDFSPISGGPLVPAVSQEDMASPPVDFFGFRRGPAPMTGAVEHLSRPIPLDLKP